MLLLHHDVRNGQRLCSCVQVSALSYGSWVSFHNQLDTQNAKALMGQCFDAGVNFFDNSEAYAKGQSEVVMGEAIKELGWKRSDVVLSTKIFWVSTAECLLCCSVFSQLKQRNYCPVLCCYRVPAVGPMTRVSAANTSSRAPRCMTDCNAVMQCAKSRFLCRYTNSHAGTLLVHSPLLIATATFVHPAGLPEADGRRLC